MKTKHIKKLNSLLAAGMNYRYGDNPSEAVLQRLRWEKKIIVDAGFIDYYLLAFWIFRFHEINVWARGAMSSSIVCFCLGLTEVDPIKYGLHSARFVNGKPPQFQFDIDESCFDEFMKEAEKQIQLHAAVMDITSIRPNLLNNLTPMGYLSRRNDRPLPESIDDELASYALYNPETMDLYKAYTLHPDSFDGIIYQEQMMDILQETYHVGGVKANDIRIAIQRGETEQVKAYKKELFASLPNITPADAETAWQRLTSNPHAFLKAHAVSRVLASYHYNYQTFISNHSKGDFRPFSTTL